MTTKCLQSYQQQHGDMEPVRATGRGLSVSDFGRPWLDPLVDDATAV